MIGECRREAEALKALRQLLAVVDETDERGEPVIGQDSTGTVNWLLDFADKIRPIVETSEIAGNCGGDCEKQ